MKPYNNTNSTENMNQVNNHREPQIVTDKGGRQCYAFILYVGGEISRVLTCGWWSSYNDAERTADGMAVAAVSFKKTAAVVAYALQDNDVYELMITRNVGSRDRVLYKIHRSRLESGKYIAPTKEEQTEYFNQKDHDRYSGAECMPVGWMDAQTAQNENATVIEPVRNHRISTDADEIKATAFDAPQWAKVGAVCRYNESHAVVKILKTMNEHKGALVEFCSCCKDEKPFFLSYEYMKPYECPEWCKVGARVVRNHPYYTASNGLHGTIINRYDDWSFVVQWDDSFKERDVWYFDLLAETEAKKESVCNVPEWAEVGKSVGHYLDYGDGTGDMLFGEVTEHERMEDGGVLVHFGGYIAPLDKIRPYTPADKEKNVTDDSGSYCHVSKSDVLGDTSGDQNRPKPWAVDMTPKEFWRLQSDWDADELPEEDAEIIGHYFHADFGVAGAMTVFVHGYAGNEAHAMVTVYHVDGLSHDEESFVQNVLPIATFFPLLTPERGWQRMTAKEIEERRACL